MSDSMRPHRRQPTRLPRPWDSPGKNTGVGCHFLLQCVKVKSESELAQSCLTLATPCTAAFQAPPPMGFSRQEFWSGLPLPSPSIHSSLEEICLYFWPAETLSTLSNPGATHQLQDFQVWAQHQSLCLCPKSRDICQVLQVAPLLCWLQMKVQSLPSSSLLLRGKKKCTESPPPPKSLSHLSAPIFCDSLKWDMGNGSSVGPYWCSLPFSSGCDSY